MCDPLTIGSLALTAGSMAANSMAQSKVEKARKGAMTAESIRQKALDQEADALNVQSRDRYQDFQGQEDKKATDLGAYFKDQNQAVPSEEGAPSETMPSSSSNIVVQEQKKQLGKAKKFSDQQGEALGNLRAFGDLLGGISRNQARDAAQVGEIGGFKRGSANVLPLELEAANSKGNSMKMFGDLLGGVGSVGLSAGLNKGGYNLFGLNSAANTATKASSVVPGVVGPGGSSYLMY